MIGVILYIGINIYILYTYYKKEGGIYMLPFMMAITSIMVILPKYVTIENENEKLPYQKAEMGRAKSAMFFPLYIDNIYIGYWIMESGQMHAFDRTDTTIIEVVKDNIISVLKTVAYQDTIENIDRIDQNTELHTADYLYGKAKIVMDGYPTSAVCMFRISNIEAINEEFGRQTGNDIIRRNC